MAAYFIVDLDITDMEGFREYQQLAGATVEQYGGKYLVRGEVAETLEGDWQIHRMVMLEFESMEQAKRWYDSAEYAAIIGIRHRTAKSEMILVQGV
ncbi:MAG: DUF1330 domain-containing protein [Ktedonobacteraceae bacterium]